jgi:hypothetical protein
MTPTTQPDAHRPGASRLAPALVGVEGLAAVVASIGFAVAAVAGTPHDRGTALVLAALLALYGAGVVLVARGLWRHQHWARTPALLVQFFALVVAWYQRSTLPAVAFVTAAVAVATLVPLLRSLSDPPEG